MDLTAVPTATGAGDLRLPVLTVVLVTAWTAVSIAVHGAPDPHRLLRRLGVLGIATAIAGVAVLQWLRDRTRHDDYVHGHDLHAVFQVAAPGWNLLDDPDRPARIAYVTGWSAWGCNWFVYPLLGRRLQNELLFVPATRSGEPGSYRPNATAEPATAEQWIERLRQARADVLFVAMPAPPELAWAEANPQVFKPRASDAGYHIYDLLW
jgi:hypothetical protein